MMRKLAMASLVAVAFSGCGPQFQKSTVVYDMSNPAGSYDVYRARGADGPRPAVVFFHGGAFMAGDKKDAEKYAAPLCARGYIVIAPDYRLTSSGYRWPAQLDDARAVLRHVRANRAALGVSEDVAVMGASAGAALALLTHLCDDPAAPGQRPSCCVDISGETDLTLEDRCFADWDSITALLLGPGPYSLEKLRELSPLAHVRSDAHVLIAHSTRDSNVYIANADRMAAALSAAHADVRYARLVGFAHGDDLWLQCGDARGEVYAFLASHLKG